jgi:4'-phosphopantetheinyl transferase EntD
MKMSWDTLTAEEPRRARIAPQARRENSVGLSPALAGLFPPGAVGAELRTSADRTHQFAAGRLCARRALAELGFFGYPLGMNSDRRPQWPADVVGSITHTIGTCGAVVAERGRFCAIGLDMEVVGRVTPEIWPTICTAEETAWLSALREPEQSRCAALIFSAKESFYKCQYGVTRQWLEFDDVTLVPLSPSASAGRFTLRPRKRIALPEQDMVSGRFEFRGGLVVTGMALEAR